MRFVNNEALGVAGDPFGPFSAVSVSIPASTGALAILAAPATGFMYRLRLLLLNAPTTVAPVVGQYIAITGSITLINLLVSYSQTNGIEHSLPCDLIISEGLTGRNTMTVAAGAQVWYRLEPIPQ